MNKGNKNKKILVVDDRTANVKTISNILEREGYAVVPAYNGGQALKAVEKEHPDLVILDMLLPDLDGQKVCRMIKEKEETSLLPVIMITALSTVDDKIQSIESGADNFLSKPINKHELLARVKSLLKIKCLTDHLISAERVVQSLAMAIEEKDPYTKGHSLRVGEYAAQLGKEIELPKDDIDLLRRAAVLHDIGMIGIDQELIHKPGKLTKQEYAKIKEHPTKSIEILKPLDLPPTLISTIKHHHEWWNGRGYPDNLARNNILLGARILAITDAFDAMTSQRPFRAAMGITKALNRLEDGMNRQWDPDLVAVFISLQIKGLKKERSDIVQTI